MGNNMQLCVFSKHLAGPSLEETAQRLRALNILAIDLTVRAGGHIEPERVKDDLPRAHEVLGANGVRIGMITTGILEATEAHTAAILRTAHLVGVSHYKLGYYGYKGFGTLRAQRADVRAKLRDLAQLNGEIGIVGGFHNHSHNFFGASLHDIAHVLESIDPQHIGLYFDAAHASIEGGSSGWIQGLDGLSERVVMLAVKDYRWVERGYGGGRSFGVQWNPLENGNVPWPEVLKYLKQSGFDGPVSLHSEYQGNHSFRDLTTDEVFEQTARDVIVFRQWLREAG